MISRRIRRRRGDLIAAAAHGWAAADVGSGASLLDATQPPAPFNAAKDVDDILPGRISHPGVLYQERLGYQQDWRQVLPAEPLADKVREAHTLATVDRSEAAAFAVEQIGRASCRERVSPYV